jgi:hypothetical protein
VRRAGDHCAALTNPPVSVTLTVACAVSLRKARTPVVAVSVSENQGELKVSLNCDCFRALRTKSKLFSGARAACGLRGRGSPSCP